MHGQTNLKKRTHLCLVKHVFVEKTIPGQ